MNDNYSNKNNDINNIDFNSIFDSFSDSNTSHEMPNSENSNFSNDFNFSNFFGGQNEAEGSANSFPNFDIGTIMKMKSVMDKMKGSKNDPRANLLRSLKPYLKPSRKEQVDKYISIFSMSQVFEGMSNIGGEKKNDV